MKKLIAIILFFNLQAALCSLKLHAQSLDSAEYFFDTDPGIGNGITITITSGDTILDSVYTSTAGLASGFHNLFVRVKDSNQVWSLYEGGKFYLYDTITQSIPPSHPIAAAEYFYDIDPGIDSGIAIVNFSQTDTLLLTDTLSTDTLPAGTHHLFVRVRDTVNVWSLYEVRTFVICDFVPAADFVADTVCINTPTTFTDLSTNVDTSFNYTYSWDFNNDHITDDSTKGNTSHVFSTSGTLTVSLIVNNTNGCSDTIVKTIYVDSLPIVTLAFPVDTICKDDTLMLAGGSPVGGVYSGNGVYGGAIYGDSISSGIHPISYTYYNSDSCSAVATAFMYVSHCTGINEHMNDGLSVTVSPNPFNVSANLSLHNSKFIDSMEFALFDVFGKEVRNLKITSGSLKLERGSLTQGIYFYKVIGENGNYVSGKLVVID